MEGSRQELHQTLEKPALKPLPDRPFPLGTWQNAVVFKDYHIQIDKHFYSVPYTYVGKTVQARVTDRSVEVYCDGVRLVTHHRSFLKGKATTLPEHRSEAHRATVEQDAALAMIPHARLG